MCQMFMKENSCQPTITVKLVLLEWNKQTQVWCVQEIFYENKKNFFPFFVCWQKLKDYTL